jgi:hypothetical protein
MSGHNAHEKDPKHEQQLAEDFARSKAAGHEVGEINPASVYKFMIWLGVFVVFSYFLVYGILKMNDARVAKENLVTMHLPESKSDELPPQPRLQLAPGSAEHPIDEGIYYRDSVIRELESYGYLNKATGSVHIPIDLAKDLLLKRGLPVRANIPPDENDGRIMIPDWSSSGRVSVRRDQRTPGGTFTVTGGNLNVQSQAGSAAPRGDSIK